MGNGFALLKNGQNLGCSGGGARERWVRSDLAKVLWLGVAGGRSVAGCGTQSVWMMPSCSRDSCGHAVPSSALAALVRPAAGAKHSHQAESKTTDQLRKRPTYW